MQDSEHDVDAAGWTRINVRNLSVKCGRCGNYQALVGFERGDEWNTYRYECENETCDLEQTRTLIEVPSFLDEFADRNPAWKGGRRHAGS